MSTEPSPSNVKDLDKARTDKALAEAGGATLNGLMVGVTEAYLRGLDRDNPPPPDQIERELLARVNFAYAAENAKRQGPNKIPLLRTLTLSQVGDILIHVHGVVRLAPGGDANTDRDSDLLGYYCPDPDDDNYGLHLTALDDILELARAYHRDLSAAQTASLLAYLRQMTRRVKVQMDRDLIPLRNGVFQYRTKELLPFSPDLVFLAKAAVDWDADAENPVIEMDDGELWDVESWMADLTEDPEIAQSLWEITGALLRPYVRWNKAAFPYSTRGNNGKGTVVQMWRCLLGPSRTASIPIAALQKDFALEQLTRAMAILVDENPVGTYIDDAANFKTIVTNDVLMINRKNKQMISYKFWGFMVQCLNEFPMMRDKSESLYRRQLFIPFTKCFTGRERTEIKDDYLQRPEVLRYVAKKVLLDMDDYYELSEPTASKVLLDEYKLANDPVRAFWDEHKDELTNDFLPGALLVALFKGWSQRRSGDGRGYATTPTKLQRAVEQLAAETGEWVRPSSDPQHQERVSGRLDRHEPLVALYGLEEWAGTLKTSTRATVPDWDSPPSAGAAYRPKYKWCLIRTGHNAADQAAIVTLRLRRAEYEAEAEDWRGYFAGLGMDEAGIEFHLDTLAAGRGCACADRHLDHLPRQWRSRENRLQTAYRLWMAAWDETQQRGIETETVN